MSSIDSRTNLFWMIPTEEYETALEEGINAFKKDFFESSSTYSLTARGGSIFSLVKKHIDSPYRSLLESKNEFEIAKKIVPSNFGKLVPDQLLDKKIYKHLDPHQKSLFNLEQWFKELRKYQKSIDPDQIFYANEELIYLIGELKRVKPKRSLVKNDISSLKPEQKTIRYRKPNKYCELCWEYSMRYKESINSDFYKDKSKSEKYCKNHDPSGAQSRSNYIRDRRYKTSFDNELKALTNRNHHLSHFVPNIKWYFTFLKGLDVQEQRKLAYELSHSRLNTDVRIKIINLYKKNIPITKIATELGITRQAVHKNLAYIETKIRDIYNNCFIDINTRQPSKIPRQLRMLEDMKHLSSMQNAVITYFARCYFKVSDEPPLIEMLNAKLQSI